MIYFDFDQFSKFKEQNPEFLEWLDNPENQIEELLRESTQSKEPKIEWEDFVEYHEEAMAFIERTETAMHEVYELLSGQDDVGSMNSKAVSNQKIRG